MQIREHYDEIARCNRCGFCQVACPIFRATGQEAGVARGRIAMLRALVEGRATWSKELEDPLFACLLCGACTANCFPAVSTADLIKAARSEYLERVGRKPLHRVLFDHLLPYPRRVRLAGHAAGLGKRTRISQAAKALGLLRCFGRDFEQSEGIIERFPAKAFRETVQPGEFSGEGDSLRLAYFVGCGTDVMCPTAGEAALRLLRQIGKTVTVLDNCCCGLPPTCYGEQASAQRLAEQNIALLTSQPFDLIVTDCSSCAAFLKKYPALFPANDPRGEAAKLLVPKLRDLLEVATLAPQPLPRNGQRITVTYHDSCHAVRGQGLASQPRAILKSLKHVEYRELPEADWCCGGAGSYALTHYELSRQVLDRKMENVAKTGAQVLATSCPACIIQLSYGVRQHHLPVRVCHVSEVLTAE
jgi:glycolate oxidase iron-sulfur subunit